MAVIAVAFCAFACAWARAPAPAFMALRSAFREDDSAASAAQSRLAGSETDCAATAAGSATIASHEAPRIFMLPMMTEDDDLASALCDKWF